MVASTSFIDPKKKGIPRAKVSKMFDFLRGIKMIVPAAGRHAFVCKGRRKRPEETWLVLITDVLAIIIISHQASSKLANPETIYYHHVASVYCLGSISLGISHSDCSQAGWC